nr:hypothetical protein [Tanacetum cinerariifolium]
MIQVKEMMRDKDLNNSKSKDEGSWSRSQSMNVQSHYKQENLPQERYRSSKNANIKDQVINKRVKSRALAILPLGLRDGIRCMVVKVLFDGGNGGLNWAKGYRFWAGVGYWVGYMVYKWDNDQHKMPTNIKVYEGITDPKDHLNRFSNAANLGEWIILIWCRTFQQTLNEFVRGWFERLPPGSIHEWFDLREAFMTRYSMQKVCFKEPYE